MNKRLTDYFIKKSKPQQDTENRESEKEKTEPFKNISNSNLHRTFHFQNQKLVQEYDLAIITGLQNISGYITIECKLYDL